MAIPDCLRHITKSLLMLSVFLIAAAGALELTDDGETCQQSEEGITEVE